MSNDPNAEITAMSDIAVAMKELDAEEIKRVLVIYNPLPAELVAHVTPLLDDRTQVDQANQAARALRLVAPRHLGSLLDTVLLNSTPLAVKRRICEILEQVPSQRCVSGLLEMLDEDDLELRLRAAASLLGIHRRNPALKIPQQRVFDAATSEALICAQVWRARRAVDRRVSAMPLLESAQGQRVVQGITYISALLLTVLDPQPTGLAFRALANRAVAHRGTGLEYLQNVLPERLLNAILPLLEDQELALGKVQPRAGILADLTRNRQSDADMLAALRKRVDQLRSDQS